jgi:hypothetical protein
MNFNTLPLNRAMMWSSTLDYWLQRPDHVDADTFIKTNDGKVYIIDNDSGEPRLYGKLECKLVDNDWE